MLRYDRQTKPRLVAFYDIRPGNGAGLFLQPGLSVKAFKAEHTVSPQYNGHTTESKPHCHTQLDVCLKTVLSLPMKIHPKCTLHSVYLYTGSQLFLTNHVITLLISVTEAVLNLNDLLC